MAGTFTITKIDLKRILASFKAGEKNIESITNQLDRMHRHVNVLAFAEMLSKIGLMQDDIINILRRAGIDDVTISNIFDALEEERMRNTFGKLIELTVD